MALRLPRLPYRSWAPNQTRRIAMTDKKANKGHKKGKTLKAAKSLEKKLPLDSGPTPSISLSFQHIKQ
jgi:hypothetical protein